MALYQLWDQNTHSFCNFWTHSEQYYTLIVLTLCRTMQLDRIPSAVHCVVRWNPSWPGTHQVKKKDEWAFGQKKLKKGKKETKKMQEKKKRGLSLRILHRRNSFEDKPFYKGSSCTVQKNLDIVGKTHRFNKQCFTRLKCVEAINLFW